MVPVLFVHALVPVHEPVPTLADWTATGELIARYPVARIIVTRRATETRIGAPHAGWIVKGGVYTKEE
jgi:hypothetical protein